MSIFNIRYFPGAALVALSAIALPAVPAAASPSLLVPAYFYPGTGGPGGVGDGWAAMTTAAAGGASIVAVMNPNSGPGASADSAYTTALTNLEAAGGTAIAYVPTGGGSDSLTTVESQVATYIAQYGGLIKGFFLDEMNVLPSTLSYYQSLNSYIKALSPSYLTVGNPGHPFLNGVSPASYLSVADVLNVFEGPDTGAPGAAGFNNFPYGQSWFQTAPAGAIANIVFDVQDAATMTADIAKSISLNAGALYVTDLGAGGANPYDALPSYWTQEVAALPEPGTALVLGFAALALRRRRKQPIRA